MATRRGFVAGMVAAGLAPAPVWADAGSPSWLAAARLADGSFRLVGLGAGGEELFRLPLPGRGHAAAAHPTRPEAVAFARRPGRFAVVIDCRNGRVLAELESPPMRHFYGHGAYTADGTLLLTSENDYEAVRGMIGVWDVRAGYLRVHEVPSGGLGPHEILRLPDEGFAVANGGIETDPTRGDGRDDLNIPTMQPNLALLTPSGALAEVVELAPDVHQNSIRHLAARADGLVAAGLQWQGDAAVSPPLLMLHRRGQSPRLLQAPPAEHLRLHNYVGSIAFSGTGDLVAVTSPKGGLVQMFDPDSGEFAGSWQSNDLCGVAGSPEGFAVTTGGGVVAGLSGTAPVWSRRDGIAFDNHLVPVGAVAG